MRRIPFLLLLLASGTFVRGEESSIADTPFWQEYREAFLVAPTAEENDVRAITLDAKGRPVLATRAGLRIIRDGQWQSLNGVDPAGPVFGVARDDLGAVWAAAWNGVYRIDDDRLVKVEGTTGPIGALSVTTKAVFAGGPDGLWLWRDGRWQPQRGGFGTSIRDVATIGDVLWIATDMGLYRVADGDTKHYYDADQLCSRECRSLTVAPDGRLWVATGDGFDVFQGEEHVGRYQEGDHAPPARDIRALAVDGEGRIWGASSLGVVRFDGQSWALRHSERWLPSDDARDLYIDGEGDAWVATARGVAHLRRKRVTLADKAAHYESIVRARHVRAPGLVEKCLLPRRGEVSQWKPVDTDNDGQYTGTYLVAESYRYAVTGADDARANAKAAYDALEFLQTVTETSGFIARTVIPSDWTQMADPNHVHTPQEIAEKLVDDPRDKPVDVRWRKSRDGRWLWKGDTSSDEITGHFYAYGVYYDLVADDAEKERVRALVRRVMDYLIEGGFELRDTDGQPTRWGIWSPRRLNDDPNWTLDRGVNSVEMLSYLATAHHMTGDEKYRQAAEQLYSEHHYGTNVRRPQMGDPGAFTYIDSELLALAYRGLFAHDRAPDRQGNYRAGVEQWFELNRPDYSPYYHFVYTEATGNRRDVQQCVDYLRAVPLDMIQWTVDNSRRNDVRLVRRPYADAWQVDRVLPASERAILKWDANPYRAIDGEGGETESPAVSWLMPYWLGRHLGVISAPE